MKFRLFSKMLFTFLLVLLAFVALPLQAQDDEEEVVDHLHIMTNFEEAEFTKISLTMTLEEAEEEGYVMLSECVPGMGIHGATMGEQGPEQPLLIFNAGGDIIGIEFESLTEQPGPAWEHLEEGHEGMEFEHWTLHVYFTHEPELACEEMEMEMDDEEGEEEGPDHLHIMTNFEEAEFTKISLTMTLEEAEEEEYVILSECVPGMGIHGATIGEQGPEQPLLLFNADGDIIGIEFESLTEQPGPAWEHLEEGHEGMEFEHWTLHVYFTHEPTLACETEES